MASIASVLDGTGDGLLPAEGEMAVVDGVVFSEEVIIGGKYAIDEADAWAMVDEGTFAIDMYGLDAFAAADSNYAGWAHIAADGLDLVGVLSSLARFNLSGADAFSAADALNLRHAFTETDAFALTDLSRIRLILKVLEIVDLEETLRQTLGLKVPDGLYVGDLCKLTWVKLITDALSLTEFFKADFGQKIVDLLRAEDRLTVLQKLTREILDGLRLQDHPAIVWEFLLADSLAATDSVNALLSILMAEALGLTDAAGPDMGLVMLSIAESMGFTDAAYGARLYSLMIGDALSASDAAISGFLLSASLSDGFELAVDPSFVGGVSLRAEEIVTFTGTAGVMQALSILVKEGLDFTLAILDGNEYWEAWAVNATDFHVSVYSNFDFNSYAEFNKEIFGAKEDGIYRIGGTTDAGTEIRAGLILHETALSSAQMKRVRRAWLGVVESGGTRKPAIRMETEDGVQKTYTVKAGKADFSRQQKGRRWTVSVGDFTELDFIEIVPILMVR